MNHEKPTNVAYSTPATSAWSSLDGESRFTPDMIGASNITDISDVSNTPESTQALKDRLAEAYQGNIVDLVMSLYDGSPWEHDERKDPDNYVELEALNKIIGVELQRQMVEEYCQTGRVDNMKQGVAEKIADFLTKSEYAEQLATDPFLRDLHIKRLAGRFEPEAEAGKVLDVLFRLDSGFSELSAVSKLLSDLGYIHKTYGRCIERATKKQIDEAEPEGDQYNPIRQKSVIETESRLSSQIRQILDEESGTLLQEELLHDPFLRKQHCEELVYGKTDAFRRPLTKVLWEIDKDFFDSMELRDFLDKVSEDNDAIFNSTDPAETQRKVTEVLEKVSDVEIERIIEAYATHPKTGDQTIVSTLSPLLGLQGQEPRLVYGDKSQAEDGSDNADYSYLRNEITYYKHDEEEWKKLRFDSGMGMPRELPYGRIGTIAHEMWHAHQYRGEDVPDRALYELNDRLYIEPEWSYDFYRRQILEREAFAFGEAFSQRVNNYYEDYKDE